MPIKKIKKKRIKAKRIKRKPTRTAKTVGTSMAEKDFKKYLNSIGVAVDEQFQLLYKFYDFIVKDTNIIIEFDGDYWHCNPAVYPNGPENKMQKKAIENDRYKTALAQSKGYTIIRVWEKDFNENEPTVKKKILEAITDYRVKDSLNKIKAKK